MAYQSKESSIELQLHLTEPIRVLSQMEVCIVKRISYGNPYEVHVFDRNGVCFACVEGYGCLQIKETMEEVCKMLEVFKGFDKEFDKWYNKLLSDLELRRLVTGM